MVQKRHNLIQLLKEFYTFLSNPVYDYKRNNPLTINEIVQLFFAVFMVGMLGSAYILGAVGIEDIPHAMSDMMDNMSLPFVFLMAVIVAPVLEELIFRFHLRYKPLMVLFILCSIVYMIYLMPGDISSDSKLTEGLLGLRNEHASSELINFFITSKLVKVILTALVVFVLYLLVKRFRQSIDSFLDNFFGIPFYLTVAIFAFVHIYNFELPSHMWFYGPLMVMPQVVIGLLLGYVRVRNGICHSILVHAMNNSIPMLIMVIAQYTGMQM